MSRPEFGPLAWELTGLRRLPPAAQAKAQGKAHLQLARSLSELVELPFAKWTDEHRSRLADSRRVVLDSWVGAWEAQREDVRKLKVLRGEKARSAEVAEAEYVARLGPSYISPELTRWPVRSVQRALLCSRRSGP